MYASLPTPLVLSLTTGAHGAPVLTARPCRSAAVVLCCSNRSRRCCSTPNGGGFAVAPAPLPRGVSITAQASALDPASAIGLRLSQGLSIGIDD